MIKLLHILRFKRFADQRIELPALSVLAGRNGAGKTSVIHALLLIAESARPEAGGVVRLNEAFGLELGTAEDVRHWGALEWPQFDVQFASGAAVSLELDADHERSMYLRLPTAVDISVLAPFARPRGFTYLSAERLGPRGALASQATDPNAMTVGVQGQQCAQLLATLGARSLGGGQRALHAEPRLKPGTDENIVGLHYQVEAWLSEIVRPVEIEAQTIDTINLATLRFRAPGGEWVRPTNMGFGVSYALPVVLAALIAPKGSLLVVENPEAHLHPAGQSRMGSFLAWAAGHGVQVVVETHSDHTLNGMRRGVAEQRVLPAEEAVVYFFPEGEQGGPEKLRFQDRGGLSAWPKGFFDQQQEDLGVLGRIRRLGG
jgi:predicted ATPase